MFLRLGSIPTLIVSFGDALKSIFKCHDLTFFGRPILTAAKMLSFNNANVSFAPYGESWRQACKLCVVELLSSKRVRPFCAVREQDVEMLVTAVKNLSSSPSSLINLSEMVFALSYNIMCHAVFGDKHGAVREPTGDGEAGFTRSWRRRRSC